MQFPIIIGLRRSFLAASVIVFLSMLGLAACWLSLWPLAYKAAISVLILLYGLISWRGLRLPASRMRLEKSGRISLVDFDSDEGEALEFLRPPIVHPWLIALAFRESSGKKCYLALFPDNAAKEDLRRLRVVLRWQVKIKSGDA